MEPARFSWWRGEIRRRIARSMAVVAQPVFAEAVVVDRAPRSKGAAAHLIVDLGHGHRIEVPPNFDEGALRRLIGVLAPC